MLTAFKDGTKTMVELAAMCNATGFVPDVPGCHGIQSDIHGLNQAYRLKEQGGILSRHKVVEYVDGIAPGVFVTVTTDRKETAYQLEYLLLGSGPLWTLYRPYHLCSIETPLSIAKAVIDREATILPGDALTAECVTVAKKDLAPGERLGGMGSYCTYGRVIDKAVSDRADYVPYGLVTDQAVMKRAVRRGALLTMDDVGLDEGTMVYGLRKGM